MRCHGESIWTAEIRPGNPGCFSYRVCPVDAAGNETCSRLDEARAEQLFIVHEQQKYSSLAQLVDVV